MVQPCTTIPPEIRTIPTDLSTLIPVLPASGPRAPALAAALRALIMDGRLVEGEKLPPSRVLAQRLGLSRGIVVAAYEHLIAEGFAAARVGAGTEVAKGLPTGKAPAAEMPAPQGFAAPMPGQMGLGMVDRTSLAQFRKLLNQSLMREAALNPGYPDPRGSESLRVEIAAYLRLARAARVHPDQIILTTGAQQAIDLILRSVLAPGDRVWVESPCYPKAVEAIRANGVIPVPVPVGPEGLDVQAGQRLAPEARAAFVTPSHQFPLGVVMSMRRRIELLRWAEARDGWIIEDDYDSEFRYLGAPLAALQGVDRAERVIYVGSFSKVLIPGLRCGYVIVPRALLPKLLAMRECVDRSPVNLMDAAMTAFLRDGHFARHLKRARTRAQGARDALVAGLSAKGIPARAPDQGLHLIIELDSPEAEAGLTARLARAGLAARPLSAMFLPGAEIRHGLVIGFSGFDPEVFAAATARIAEV